MDMAVLSSEIRHEHDVVSARRRARQIAGLLGFDSQDQVRIATAVSEISRNAFQYAGGGRIEFLVGSTPSSFTVRVSDRGPGIADLATVLDGRFVSTTGMGVGLSGVRRLMDRLEIDSSPGAGTTVVLAKNLPAHAPAPTAAHLAEMTRELCKPGPQSAFDEVRLQNQELLQALDRLQQRQEELSRLNRELDDTNRGVVALYAELDERADYLRRASDLKSSFLANMSHEFRTPLNSILSLSRMLLDRSDGALTEEQERQVLYIRSSAAGLSELVDDLLDLAKVEAGKVTLTPHEFHVSALFGALRGMLKPLLAANSSITLTFEEPDDSQAMFADEGKVSQILRNFISNALKYTESGEVRVSARSVHANEVAISVVDTGIGVAEENHERIFQQFTQVESSHQRVFKGTGLGLPLSRKLAELLGGRIELRSALGVGSTFTLILPRRALEATEPAATPAAHCENTVPILFVEDNEETMFQYRSYLKETAYQLLPARGVRTARRIIEEGRPKAVVLDILLQGENTWEFLAQLKSDEATRDLPVLVCTLIDNRPKAMALGADAFCVKPLDRDGLLAELERLAPIHRN